MMLQKSWVRSTAAAMILGVAGLASAAVVHFSETVSLPGITTGGTASYFEGVVFIGTDTGTLKGHIHRKGKVHAVARGTVQNRSGARFHTHDTAAIAAFIPGTIGGESVTLKSAHYSVSRDGRALFKGKLQVN